MSILPRGFFSRTNEFSRPGRLTASKRRTAKHRRLRAESLERRELLSATGEPWAFGVNAGGGTSTNFGTVDDDGNSYLAGIFSGTVDFDPGPSARYMTASVNNGFIAKYASDGSFCWSQTIPCTVISYARAVTVDGSDAVYVVGSFSGAATIGDAVFTSKGGTDGYVAQLEGTTGNLLNAWQIGGTGDDSATGAAVDSLGNLYVTGGFSGTVDADPGPDSYSMTAESAKDIYVIKLDVSGDFVGAKSMGGDSVDVPNALAVDSAGDVYITGEFAGTAAFGSFNLTAEGTASNLFVAKLDGSTLGVEWAKRGGGVAGSNCGYGIALDDNSTDPGNWAVVVAGNVSGTEQTGGADFDSIVLETANGAADVLVAKLDADNGDFLWARQMGGLGDDQARGVALDQSGNIFTIGLFKAEFERAPCSSDFDPSPDGQRVFMANIHYDGYLSKLDAEGNYVSAWQIGGAAYDFGCFVGLDSGGMLYAGGAGQRRLLPPNDQFVSSTAYLFSMDPNKTPLTGRVFFDTDQDGQTDFDPGIAGQTVFLDLNRNGSRDLGEPTSTTDADGKYWFNVLPGTYQVCLLPQGVWTATSPPILAATVAAGSDPSVRVLGGDFGIFTSNQTTVYRSTGTPKTIVDGAVTSSTIAIPASALISDINVEVDATHPMLNHLDVRLVAPDGRKIDLVLNNSYQAIGGPNFVDTVFDHEATAYIKEGAAPFTGHFRPAGEYELNASLRDYYGRSAKGNWTLEISDRKSERHGSGTLNGWSISVLSRVNASNTPPTAVADSFEAREDEALQVVAPGVLVNDVDANGDPLAAVLVTGPAHGTVTLNSNGSFVYAPALNYNGADSFTYSASDGLATSTLVTVTLSVASVNDAPAAASDSYTITGTSLTVPAQGVLANDRDADGNPLSALLVSLPAGALALNPNGSFTYTPPAGFKGVDSFTYQAFDGNAYSAATTVTLNVANVYTSNTVKTIPDPGKVTSTLTVPPQTPSMTIADVDVKMNITHTYDEDVDVFLIAPDGTRVELFTDVGSSGDNFSNTTLDDGAIALIGSSSAPFSGVYQPEGRLSALNGLNMAGVWTLEVSDDLRRYTGKLNSWSLVITPAVSPAMMLAATDAALAAGDSSPLMSDAIDALVASQTKKPRARDAAAPSAQSADQLLLAGVI